MMFTTKKTRAISAFAAILMLLSLMTCFVLPVGAAGDETYTIYRELWMAGKKVMDLPAVEGVVAANEVDLSTLELGGYALVDKSELHENEGVYIMPANDITLIYYNTVVDLDPLNTALAMLNQYDLSLFAPDAGDGYAAEDIANDITALLEELEGYGVEDGMSEADLKASGYGAALVVLNEEIADLVVAATSTGMKLKNEAPYLPDYSDKDLYTGFGCATGSSLVGYMISDAEDWFAVLKDAQLKKADFAGITLYLKNDVDLAEFDGLRADLKEILPKFAGTLDGRGYSFKNVVINEAVLGAPVGLIGTLTGTVKNLGIASGSVTSAYKAIDNSYGVAAVVGKAEAGAKISKVWNAADVKVTGTYGETEGVAKKDYPVAGIVGVAAAGVKINGCYNLGVISGGDRVAELANGSAAVTNSFAAGANALVEGVSDGVLAANNVYRLDATDPYAFAHKLNSGYIPAEEPVYYTVDANGALALVYDNDDKAIVKVTVNAVSTNSYPATGYSFYAYADSLVKLEASYAIAGTYQVSAGNAAIVNGDYLQLNQSDVTVTVQTIPLNPAALDAVLPYYENKDPEAFEESEKLAALLAEARKNNYASQDALNAAAAELVAFKGQYTTSNPAKLPAVSKMANYLDAVGFGYTIRTVEDLKLVAAAPNGAYGKLYLSNDLNLSGETFDGLENLAVAFDGLENTISGWTDADGGFFDGFTGGTIENVTFSGAKTEGAAVVINETAVAVALNNVHVKNAVIEKADAADLGFLVGKATAKVTITDSSVLESKMLASNGVYTENHGILVGNAADAELKNIVATGNTLTGVALNGGAGLLVGNAAGVVAENIAVTYNNINVKADAAEGMALISNDADAVVANIFAESNKTTYDGLNESGALSLLNAGGTDRAKVYADAETALDKLNDVVTNSNGYVGWTLDATYKTPTLVIDGRTPSYTIIFNNMYNTFVAMYRTDENGHLFGYSINDDISMYVWTGVSALQTHVFTEDTTMTAAASVDHMVVRVVGAATKDNPANVQVNIVNNPELDSVWFKVTFDNEYFELVDVANGELFNSLSEQEPDKDYNAEGSFEVIVHNDTGVAATKDGVAFKFALLAKDTATELTNYEDAVTVEVIEAIDSVYNNVSFEAESTDIYVDETIVWGDVTNDGNVDSADVSMLLQYIVGKIDAVTNAAAGELDGVNGLSVVDAQIIFRALANNAADTIKPLTIA